MRRIVMLGDPMDRSRIDQGHQETDDKPSGLWYACDLAWVEWVRNEAPDWMAEFVYELDIDMSSILRIGTEAQFRRFETKYATESDWDNPGDLIIEWPAVALDYDGIEICPYRASERDSYWYGTWDVASGCIWKQRALKSAKRIHLE